MMIIEPNLGAILKSAQMIQKVVDEMRSERGFQIGPLASDALARLPMKKVARESGELVMIRGTDLGAARCRTTHAVHREGIRRRLLRPTPDAALVLRDALPMEALEYRQIVFMHKPIRDREQNPSLFCWERGWRGSGDRHALLLLEAYPGTIWSREAVFIFEAAPETSPMPVRKVSRRLSQTLLNQARPRPCWAI